MCKIPLLSYTMALSRAVAIDQSCGAQLALSMHRDSRASARNRAFPAVCRMTGHAAFQILRSRDRLAMVSPYVVSCRLWAPCCPAQSALNALRTIHGHHCVDPPRPADTAQADQELSPQ